MKTLVNIVLTIATVILFVIAIIGMEPEYNMFNLFFGCCGAAVLLILNFNKVKEFTKDMMTM